MYRTFSLKGTKEGFLLIVKDKIDYDLFYHEIEKCFSNSKITSVTIKGDTLPPLVRSVAEYLVIKHSAGKTLVTKDRIEQRNNEFSLFPTLRSGERLESNHSILIRGNVNSGAFLFAGETAIILGNLYGTVSVPQKKSIYVGKHIDGQIRIGENIYFLNPFDANGTWLYEQNGKLILEDNGGNLIYG